jgi:hypothetical protein
MDLIADDAELTKVLGPKCPACGHRGGQHRPKTEWLEGCEANGTATE